MTFASVSVVLMALLSLNIIWGYPWTGMAAACLALLLVGWSINRLMRPNLLVGCSLPASCPVGEQVRVVTHLTNMRRLPALDTMVHFETSKSRRRSRGILSSPAEFFPMIRPQHHAEYHSSIVYRQRGIHHLPSLLIQSTFPFYLFRSRRLVNVHAQVAITPRPLEEGEDESALRALAAVGGWARKLLAGDAIEYTGSREYQVGMPVRRWDFASWARLGRPIVREYQAPSIQAVNLVIDTGAMKDSTGNRSRFSRKKQTDETLERLLSLAVSTIFSLSAKSVHINLFVTSEELPSEPSQRRTLGLDSEASLIRLASASSVDPELGDQRLKEFIEREAGRPTLILTRRDKVWPDHQAKNVTTVLSEVADNRAESQQRTDAPHSEKSSEQSHREQHEDLRSPIPNPAQGLAEQSEVADAS